jgi:hypothetical protein
MSKSPYCFKGRRLRPAPIGLWVAPDRLLIELGGRDEVVAGDSGARLAGRLRTTKAGGKSLGASQQVSYGFPENAILTFRGGPVPQGKKKPRRGGTQYDRSGLCRVQCSSWGQLELIP